MGNANSIPNNDNNANTSNSDSNARVDTTNKKESKLSTNAIVGIVFGVLFALMCISVVLVYNVPSFGPAMLNFFQGIYQFVYTQPKFVIGFLIFLAFLISFFVVYNKQIKSTDKNAPIFSTWAKSNWIYSIVVIVLIIIVMTIFTVTTEPKYNTAIPISMWSVLMQRRINYITYFMIFLILAFLFYFYEPWNLSEDYFGQSTFAILFAGVFLFGLVLNYTVLFSAKDMMIQSSPNKPWDMFVKSLFILTALGISGGLIYWIISSASQAYSASSIFSFVVNLLLILVILGLTFKVLMSSHYIQSSPYVRLLVNLVFYIPCILVNIIEFFVYVFTSEKTVGHRTELVLLALGILLIVLYFLVPVIENYFVLQGGKQLVNDPIYINSQTGVANYMELNDLDPKHMPNPIVYQYNYGVSFWFYLDSEPSGQNKYMTIFDYGDKPRVLYNSYTNTLIITTMPNNVPNTTSQTNPALNLEDIDSKGNVIVYKKTNMKLQKWNNLILNYSGGTLDIFYNGELVRSVENIVPYMTMDNVSVGDVNGQRGGICNLIYFKNSLSTQQIKYLYNTVKDKTPPTLYSSTKSLTFGK